MITYPSHFIDEDGYEWECGIYRVRGTDEDPHDATFRWRFRPTPACTFWEDLEAVDKKWDHATDSQVYVWRIEIAKELK